MQERLRQEVTAARKDGDIGYDILMGLPYLDAVCRETLRMYPPLPTVQRMYELSSRSSHSLLIIVLFLQHSSRYCPPIALPYKVRGWKDGNKRNSTKEGHWDRGLNNECEQTQAHLG